jgi:hypothetical protein
MWLFGKACWMPADLELDAFVAKKTLSWTLMLRPNIHPKPVNCNDAQEVRE